MAISGAAGESECTVGTRVGATVGRRDHQRLVRPVLVVHDVRPLHHARALALRPPARPVRARGPFRTAGGGCGRPLWQAHRGGARRRRELAGPQSATCPIPTDSPTASATVGQRRVGTAVGGRGRGGGGWTAKCHLPHSWTQSSPASRITDSGPEPARRARRAARRCAGAPGAAAAGQGARTPPPPPPLPVPLPLALLYAVAHAPYFMSPIRMVPSQEIRSTAWPPKRRLRQRRTMGQRALPAARTCTCFFSSRLLRT